MTLNIIEKGFDASFGWPDLPTAWNAGYRFVCGYLSWDPSKDWTTARVAAARALGFDCLFNWESTVNAYQGGFAQGVRDATEANNLADALGVPANVWIWYSVDTGASPGQVRAYFQGIVSVGRRLVGGYGGSEMLTLVNEGLIKGWWESNAGSWSGHPNSGFATDAGAALRQIVGHTVNAGGSTDEDWLYSTNGLWLANGHPSAPTAILHLGEDLMFVRHSSGVIIIATPDVHGLTADEWAAINAAYAGQKPGGPVLVEHDGLFSALCTPRLDVVAASIEVTLDQHADARRDDLKAAIAAQPSGGASPVDLNALADAVVSHLAARLTVRP